MISGDGNDGSDRNDKILGNNVPIGIMISGTDGDDDDDDRSDRNGKFIGKKNATHEGCGYDYHGGRAHNSDWELERAAMEVRDFCVF